MTQDQAIRSLRDEFGLSWDHAERLISEAEELLIAEHSDNFDWSDCYKLAMEGQQEELQ